MSQIDSLFVTRLYRAALSEPGKAPEIGGTADLPHRVVALKVLGDSGDCLGSGPRYSARVLLRHSPQ